MVQHAERRLVCAVSLPEERIRGDVNELLFLVVRTPQAAFKVRPLLSGSSDLLLVLSLSLVGSSLEVAGPRPSTATSAVLGAAQVTVNDPGAMAVGGIGLLKPGHLTVCPSHCLLCTRSCQPGLL